MKLGQSMATLAIDDFIMIVQNPVPIDDEDWDVFIDTMKSVIGAHGRFSFMVETPGAGPNAKQRAKMNLAAQDASRRGAVLCDSKMVRGIIRALSWAANMEIKGFASTEHDKGFAFLETTPELREQVLKTMAQMRRDIGVES